MKKNILGSVSSISISNYLMNLKKKFKKIGVDGDKAEFEQVIQRDIAAIDLSGLFDESYYLSENPDVKKSNLDPVRHFVLHGWLEKRNPSPDFDVQYYLNRYDDVDECGINPLIHYITYGLQEGRYTSLEEEQKAAGVRINVDQFPLNFRNGPQIDEIQLDVLYYVGKLYKQKVHVSILNGELSFRKHDAPLISIIIPVYNNIDFTLLCLTSIKENTSFDLNYEIIVVDDCSSDGTEEFMGRIEGIRYLRNDENIGFVGSCNNGAMHARGEYLIFLNNDTVVLPNWADGLLATFQDIPQVGLAGAMLLYPDGKLQEAGGIIWSDGSGWNYGHSEHPYQSRFLFARDADYCSGACIMVPKHLFEKIGRFGEEYAPGYYEDTDLAFKIREAGYRTIYQPFSRVVHFEGVSAGTDLSTGMKQYQLINKERFVAKWKHQISNSRKPQDGSSYYYQDRQARKHVLIIDACTPTPDQDSGSIDTITHIRFLQKAGLRVTFVSGANLLHFGKYTNQLQAIGVECIYSPEYYSLDHYLEREGWRYELVWVYRWYVLDKFLSSIKKYCSHAKIVFDTVDLHFLRVQREADLHGDEKLVFEAEHIRTRELELMAESDVTVVISDAEKAVLDKIDTEKNVAVIPMCRSFPGRTRGFGGREESIVFIGGFQHTPNIDAVCNFIENIWPTVHERLPGLTFKVVGSKAQEFLPEFNLEGVEVLGFVEDLGDVLDHSLVTVAPLRFGAGVKGKTLSSLGHGVPTILSPIAIEGTELIPDVHCLLAETAEDYAEAIYSLVNDEQKWLSISDAGLELLQEVYAIEKVEDKFNGVLEELGIN